MARCYGTLRNAGIRIARDDAHARPRKSEKKLMRRLAQVEHEGMRIRSFRGSDQPECSALGSFHRAANNGVERELYVC